MIAIGDPVDVILQIIDQAATDGARSLSPGRAARQRDELTEALRAAQAMAWAFAVSASGENVSLYIGSPIGVRERVAAPCG